MFPFQRGDELFQIPHTTHPDNNHIIHHQHQNQPADGYQDHHHRIIFMGHDRDDLIPASSSTARDAAGSARGVRGGGRRKSPLLAASASPAGGCGDAQIGSDRRKEAHREIERLRRQEMSNLYSSLRSHLPDEYIRGKRSISDHMNEAANYIKHLQQRSKELRVKRDELKKGDTSATTLEPCSSSSARSCAVQVNACWGGVEIVIASGFRDPSPPMPISRVLRALQGDGFSVYSCVSAAVNDSVFHTIQAQVGDDTCLDLPRLQEKLFDVVSSSWRS
uniref:BHLH domain-containing protein n=1 Tax=Kalanchoe fedtschenkoi TaxID=63787 RepID=A0A7N0UAQ8_KALFE